MMPLYLRAWEARQAEMRPKRTRHRYDRARALPWCPMCPPLHSKRRATQRVGDLLVCVRHAMQARTGR